MLSPIICDVRSLIRSKVSENKNYKPHFSKMSEYRFSGSMG